MLAQGHRKQSSEDLRGGQYLGGVGDKGGIGNLSNTINDKNIFKNEKKRNKENLIWTFSLAQS